MKTLSMSMPVVRRWTRTPASDAMSQRGCTRTAASSCWPACRRSAPAKAIIAPLSVQNAGRGKQTRPPRLRGDVVQLRAQALVGADAAGDHQRVAAGRIQRALALDRQRVDHRVLEAARDVGAGLRRRWSLSRQASSTWVLRPLKLKSRPGPVGHRPRELVDARAGPVSASAASCGPPGYGRPISLAVLSKASPAASSRVSPSRR